MGCPLKRQENRGGGQPVALASNRTGAPGDTVTSVSGLLSRAGSRHWNWLWLKKKSCRVSALVRNPLRKNVPPSMKSLRKRNTRRRAELANAGWLLMKYKYTPSGLVMARRSPSTETSAAVAELSIGILVTNRKGMDRRRSASEKRYILTVPRGARLLMR